MSGLLVGTPSQQNGFGGSPLLPPSGTDGIAKPRDRNSPPKVTGGGMVLNLGFLTPTCLSHIASLGQNSCLLSIYRKSYPYFVTGGGWGSFRPRGFSDLTWVPYG